jgi:phenol hydroxylase P4 protein
MAVTAIGKYDFTSADSVDKFPAPILYAGWENHLMFCAPFAWPVPPTMRFGDLFTTLFAYSFGTHPEFAKIDWGRAEWSRSGKPWQPDYDKSVEENGLMHKDVIRFRTPGLTGIKDSCS